MLTAMVPSLAQVTPTRTLSQTQPPVHAMFPTYRLFAQTSFAFTLLTRPKTTMRA